VKKKNCFSIDTYLHFEKLIQHKINKRTILIIFIKSYLVTGFGVDWLKTLIKLIKKNNKDFKIRFYVDSGSDHGLSILLLRENIDYLKLKSNKIVLKKINQIAKKNKVLLNPNFNIVDVANIKNFSDLKI